MTISRSVGSWRFAAVWPLTAGLFASSPVLAAGSLSATSLLTVLPFASVLAIATIGATLVIQQGGLDLSVAGGISLSAVIVTAYPNDSTLPLWVLVALTIGAATGCVAGLAITLLRVTPLVATLAINALLYGAVVSLTNGQANESVPERLAGFCTGRTIGIPNLGLVALAAVIVAHLAMATSTFGRRFVLVGENGEAARAAGIRVAVFGVASYAFAGVSYAAAGVLLAGYLKTPNLFVGDQYLLPTLTAVVLGGTSLVGGSGSLLASAVGALFLTQLQQVLLGIGAATSLQYFVEALIIAVAMSLRRIPLSWPRISRNRIQGA